MQATYTLLNTFYQNQKPPLILTPDRSVSCFNCKWPIIIKVILFGFNFSKKNMGHFVYPSPSAHTAPVHFHLLLKGFNWQNRPWHFADLETEIFWEMIFGYAIRSPTQLVCFRLKSVVFFCTQWIIRSRLWMHIELDLRAGWNLWIWAHCNLLHHHVRLPLKQILSTLHACDWNPETNSQSSRKRWEFQKWFACLNYPVHKFMNQHWFPAIFKFIVPSRKIECHPKITNHCQKHCSQIKGMNLHIKKMVPIQTLSKYIGMMMVVIMMMIMMTIMVLHNYDNNKSRIQKLQGHVWRVSLTAISFLSGVGWGWCSLPCDWLNVLHITAILRQWIRVTIHLSSLWNCNHKNILIVGQICLNDSCS